MSPSKASQKTRPVTPQTLNALDFSKKLKIVRGPQTLTSVLAQSGAPDVRNASAEYQSLCAQFAAQFPPLVASAAASPTTAASSQQTSAITTRSLRSSKHTGSVSTFLEPKEESNANSKTIEEKNAPAVSLVAGGSLASSIDSAAPSVSTAAPVDIRLPTWTIVNSSSRTANEISADKLKTAGTPQENINEMSAEKLLLAEGRVFLQLDGKDCIKKEISLELLAEFLMKETAQGVPPRTLKLRNIAYTRHVTGPKGGQSTGPLRLFGQKGYAYSPVLEDYVFMIRYILQACHILQRPLTYTTLKLLLSQSLKPRNRPSVDGSDVHSNLGGRNNQCIPLHISLSKNSELTENGVLGHFGGILNAQMKQEDITDHALLQECLHTGKLPNVKDVKVETSPFDETSVGKLVYSEPNSHHSQPILTHRNASVNRRNDVKSSLNNRRGCSPSSNSVAMLDDGEALFGQEGKLKTVYDSDGMMHATMKMSYPQYSNAALTDKKNCPMLGRHHTGLYALNHDSVAQPKVFIPNSSNRYQNVNFNCGYQNNLVSSLRIPPALSALPISVILSYRKMMGPLITDEIFLFLVNMFERLTETRDIIQFDMAYENSRYQLGPLCPTIKCVRAVYDHWKTRRALLKKPFLRQYWAVPSASDSNPFAVFRARTREKMVLRRPRRTTGDSANRLERLQKEFTLTECLFSAARVRDWLKLALCDLDGLLFEQLWKESIDPNYHHPLWPCVKKLLLPQVLKLARYNPRILDNLNLPVLAAEKFHTSQSDAPKNISSTTVQRQRYQVPIKGFGIIGNASAISVESSNDESIGLEPVKRRRVDSSTNITKSALSTMKPSSTPQLPSYRKRPSCGARMMFHLGDPTPNEDNDSEMSTAIVDNKPRKRILSEKNFEKSHEDDTNTSSADSTFIPSAIVKNDLKNLKSDDVGNSADTSYSLLSSVETSAIQSSTSLPVFVSPVSLPPIYLGLDSATTTHEELVNSLQKAGVAIPEQPVAFFNGTTPRDEQSYLQKLNSFMQNANAPTVHEFRSSHLAYMGLLDSQHIQGVLLASTALYSSEHVKDDDEQQATSISTVQQQPIYRQALQCLPLSIRHPLNLRLVIPFMPPPPSKLVPKLPKSSSFSPFSGKRDLFSTVKSLRFINNRNPLLDSSPNDWSCMLATFRTGRGRRRTWLDRTRFLVPTAFSLLPDTVSPSSLDSHDNELAAPHCPSSPFYFYYRQLQTSHKPSLSVAVLEHRQADSTISANKASNGQSILSRLSTTGEDGRKSDDNITLNHHHHHHRNDRLLDDKELFKVHNNLFSSSCPETKATLPYPLPKISLDGIVQQSSSAESVAMIVPGGGYYGSGFYPQLGGPECALTGSRFSDYDMSFTNPLGFDSLANSGGFGLFCLPRHAVRRLKALEEQATTHSVA